MKKALLMGLSGVLTASISFDVGASKLTQSDIEGAVSAKTGLAATKVNNALDAFEKQLKEEMANKKAVKLDGFGQYNPREVAGMKNGRNPQTGATLQYESWRQVKKPEIVSEQAFISKAAGKAGMSEDEYAKVLAAYKKEIAFNMKRGNKVQVAGDGTYNPKIVAPTTRRNKDGTFTRIPMHRVVRYSSYGKTTHHAFKPDDVLACSLSKC